MRSQTGVHQKISGGMVLAVLALVLLGLPGRPGGNLALAQQGKDATVEVTTEPTEEATGITESTMEPTEELAAEATAEPITEATTEPTAEPTTEPTREANDTPEATVEPGGTSQPDDGLEYEGSADKLPIIFLPGATGSKLINDPNEDGKFDEVWPNVTELIFDPDDDSLRVLKLKESGDGPAEEEEASYNTVKVGDVIRSENFFVLFKMNVYKPTIEYFTSRGGYIEGKDFFVCPYDWRKDISQIAAGDKLDLTLEKCINKALERNPETKQVNILAHSMGGLVARQYVSDSERSKRVKHLVTLGTPYFGAPKSTLAIIDGVCLVEPEIIKVGNNSIKACISDPKTIQEIIRNFPGAYQLAPSDAYFKVYDGYIVEGGYIFRDKQDYLDADESLELLKEHNEGLAGKAKEFHEKVDGWGEDVTNDVEVLMIAGCCSNTISTIIKRFKAPSWGSPFINEPLYMVDVTILGDGTVPLRSATMSGEGVNLRGNVPLKVFRGREHLKLAQDDKVLGCVQDFFENIEGKGLPESCSEPQATAVEEDTLTGRFISLDGSVDLEIVDNSGNRIGYINNGGTVVNEIPGASYYETSSTISIFLPETAQYIIRVYGQQQASTDIRIQKIIADQTKQTALYDDLPLTTNSIATLNYDPNADSPGAFALDQNGDGTSESDFPPTSILDPIESKDYVSPKTTITLDGPRAPDGWFTGLVTVTMEAEDNEGGTGVAKIEYTRDSGNTVQLYTAPFIVNTDQAGIILAKATDRAGNEESPLASALLRPLSSTVHLEPINLQLAISATDTTNVQVANVSNLYGIDFRLSYDPAIVEVQDADPDEPGIQIKPGTLFEGKNYFVARNWVDPEAGVIEFIASLRDSAASIDSSGSLATITWQGVKTGTSTVMFDQAKLSNRDGAPINRHVENGIIEVKPDVMFGQVRLQSRTNHSDTYVYLIEDKEDCLASAKIAGIPIPNVPYAVTNADGYFEISPTLGRTYGCLRAVHNGFLAGQKIDPQRGDSGTITLPGGDVTSDNIIDIFDLVYVAARYDSSDPAADVNADGLVDVFDLVIVGSNYDKKGPVTDWK
jgi:hypothetical protein